MVVYRAWVGQGTKCKGGHGEKLNAGHQLTKHDM